MTDVAKENGTLRAALERMVKAFQPFRSKPIGAPHSPVRLEQEEQISAYDQARRILKGIVMTDRIDIAALREAETNYLADELGAAIANLGYPVGCGLASNRELLLWAADKLVDRYLLLQMELSRQESDTLGASTFRRDK